MAVTAVMVGSFDADDDDEDMEDSPDVHRRFEKYPCDECHSSFDDKAFLLAHKFFAHDARGSALKRDKTCPLCPSDDWRFRNPCEAKMLSHLALVHFEDVAKVVKMQPLVVRGELSDTMIGAVRDEWRQQKIDSDEFNACPLCGLLSRKASHSRYKSHDPNMFKHFKRRHPEALSTCGECGLQFMTDDALEKHKADSFHVRCPTCRKVFASKKQFLRHEVTEHKCVTGSSCLECRKYFPTKALFEEHLVKCGEDEDEKKRKEVVAMLDKIKSKAESVSEPKKIAEMHRELKILLEKFRGFQ